MTQVIVVGQRYRVIISEDASNSAKQYKPCIGKIGIAVDREGVLQFDDPGVQQYYTLKLSRGVGFNWYLKELELVNANDIDIDTPVEPEEPIDTPQYHLGLEEV